MQMSDKDLEFPIQKSGEVDHDLEEELKSLPLDEDLKDDSSSYEEGDVKRISSSSRVNFTKLTKKE